jgi:peptidylprolyl isomerase
MRFRILPYPLLFASAWLSVSCRRTETPEPAHSEILTAVAIVANTEISVEALKTELQRQFRTAKERLTSEQKLAALDALVRTEAVYAQAKAAGFDQTPEIQRRIKNLIVAHFKEHSFKATNHSVSELEIEAFYQANRDRYFQPGAARGAVIFLSAPKGMTREKKAEWQQRAEAVMTEARAAADDAAFAQVVARHSEDQASRYRGGDLGWVSRDGAGVEPAVTEALFALNQSGDFAPLVRGASGFYIVKLLEKRAANPKPLADVREVIRYQLARHKAEQAEQDFHAAMKRGLDIQINHALLESISLPTTQPEPPPMPEATTAQLQSLSTP